MKARAAAGAGRGRASVIAAGDRRVLTASGLGLQELVDVESVARRLRRETSTRAGMERWLSRFFGPGGFCYHLREDMWIAPNAAYEGPGRQFYVIRRGGSWFLATIPKERFS